MRLSELGRELRQTVRSLARSATVSALTVATVVLVICGVTLMTSFVVCTLIDAGPYRDPARVLGFQYAAPDAPYPQIYFRFDDYRELRDATMAPDGGGADSRGAVFDEVMALGVAYVMMTGGGEPAHLNAGVMPGRTFTLLGVPPLLGRPLVPADDRPGAPPVVVLSEEVWRQAFGSDPDAVGRVVRIDGLPHRIVGVMPARFTWGVLTAWLPLRMDLYGVPTGRYVQIAGWLKAGVTEEQARQRLQAAVAGLAARDGSRYPASVVTSFGHPASPLVRADVRQTVLLLLAAVLLLAVAGCLNVAALLLARATSRTRELGLRVALGAPRWRVVRGQFLEVLLLAGAGAAAGVALAYALLPVLIATLPPYVLPLGATVAIDRRVLAAMLAATLGLCAACGSLPAIVVTRVNLEPLLRQGTAAAAHSVRSRRVWRALIAGEVAMAMSLLVLTGLFAHSLLRLEAEPLRYTPDGVVQLGVTVSANRYPTRAQRTAFLSQAADRIRQQPDVDAVTVAFPSTPRSTFPASIRLSSRAASQDDRIRARIVGADFHPAYRIPLLRGRALTRADERAGLPVAVVNEAFARRYGGGAGGASGSESRSGSDGAGRADVIGQQVTVRGLDGPDGRPAPPFEIVGVTRDVPNGQTPGVTEPEVAVLFTSAARGDNWYLVVRAARGAAAPAVIKPAQRAVWALDPDQAFRSIWTEEEMLWAARFAWPRFRAFLLALFGALSLTLAAAGVYGILSYLIAGESREIGLRLALGAGRPTVVRHVLGRGLRPAALGVIAGAGVAAGGGLVVRSFAGALSPWDPIAYAAAAALLLAVTLAACYLPARRAARLDPQATLKGR